MAGTMLVVLVPATAEARPSICRTGLTVALNSQVRLVRADDERLFACTPGRRNARFVAYDDTSDDAVGDVNGVGSLRLAGHFIAGVRTVSDSRGGVFAQTAVSFRVGKRGVVGGRAGPSSNDVIAIRIRSDGLLVWLEAGTGAGRRLLKRANWAAAETQQLDDAEIPASSLALTRAEIRWTAEGTPRSASAAWHTRTAG